MGPMGPGTIESVGFSPAPNNGTPRLMVSFPYYSRTIPISFRDSYGSRTSRRNFWDPIRTAIRSYGTTTIYAKEAPWSATRKAKSWRNYLCLALTTDQRRATCGGVAPLRRGGMVMRLRTNWFLAWVNLWSCLTKHGFKSTAYTPPRIGRPPGPLSIGKRFRIKSLVSSSNAVHSQASERVFEKMLVSTTLREHLHERQTFNAKIGQLERLDSVWVMYIGKLSSSIMMMVV